MRLLAIETSSDACSVALQLGDEVHERHHVEARIHTRTLLPVIRELLTESSTEADSLDAIVLGNGPGSFIGMRIGASVAQGIAFAAGKNIVPVSSLAAVAAEVLASESGDAVVVTQDARMSEVYVGTFSRGESDLPVPVADEAIFPAGKLARLDERNDWIAAGAGWQRHPDMLEANGDRLKGHVSVLQPRASCLLGLGRVMLDSGQSLPPDRLEPAYLRQQVATVPGSQMIGR